MGIWKYKITVHELPLHKMDEAGDVIECDQAGHCLPHDALQGGVGWLEDLLSDKGKDGWELVQSGYHNRKLLCIWKREVPPGEQA